MVASAEASAASADAAVATSSAAKNTKREETANEETIADEESAADVETTKDFSEMTPKERRKAKRAEQSRADLLPGAGRKADSANGSGYRHDEGGD